MAATFRVILLIAFLTSTLGAETPPAQLRVAAVQFRIDAAALGSLAAYQDRIGLLVEKCAAYRPDLIIFPEYTAAFAALIPHHGALERSRDILEGLGEIRSREPLVRSLRDLFLLNSGFAERVARRVFGELARRHAVFLLGGSLFAWERSPGGEVELRNRALLFDPQGDLSYRQDKVYLTDFETDVLQLDPGSLRQAHPFPLPGFRAGLTLCRDTFFEAWEGIFSGADLWIDIKANGAAFSEEERARFARALPARIRSADVPVGVTVCLTGRLLDLLWEGESFLVRKDGGEPRVLLAADSPRQEEILFFTIEPARVDDLRRLQ